MDQYQYMVTYTFANGNGRVFVTRAAPIASPEDIEAIEAIQNERHGFTCAISGFFLLSHTTTNDETGV